MYKHSTVSSLHTQGLQTVHKMVQFSGTKFIFTADNTRLLFSYLPKQGHFMQVYIHM